VLAVALIGALSIAILPRHREWEEKLLGSKAKQAAARI
jgi:hypothetical protein